MNTDDEDSLLRPVTVQNGSSRLARRRSERELVAARGALSTPELRDLAKRLIALEPRGHESSGAETPAAFPVCAKLRPHLANLMGDTGFRALLARALARAEAELPSRRAMHVTADGALAVSDELDVPAGAQHLTTESVVLVAQLLGLLVSFIGERLTLQIVRDVWPKLALNGLRFFREDRK